MTGIIAVVDTSQLLFWLYTKVGAVGAGGWNDEDPRGAIRITLHTR